MADSQNIPILTRTLRVLEAVTSRGRASAKQLSMDLGIPLSTCYRILKTLTEARWLLRDDEGDYHLSFGISRLGGLAAGMARFFARAHRPVVELAGATGCSAKISVAEGSDWLILLRHDQPELADVLNQAGTRDCVLVGSVGAVLSRGLGDREVRLLAEQRLAPDSRGGLLRPLLDRIERCRARGYATDYGETNPAIHAVSIPLDLGSLEENAALTVAASPAALPPSREEEIVSALRRTARAIEGTERRAGPTRRRTVPRAPGSPAG